MKIMNLATTTIIKLLIIVIIIPAAEDDSSSTKGADAKIIITRPWTAYGHNIFFRLLSLSGFTDIDPLAI